MIRLVIIAVVFLTACSPGVPRKEQPDDLIGHDAMVELLTELVIIESHLVNEYVQINKYHKVMVNSGDSLLKANGYNRGQFERSMEYYGSQQFEMQDIYTKVLENLNEELGELEANGK